MEEEVYLGNGGINTLASYNISLSDGIEERKRKIPDRHREFFASLLAFYETDDYLFVHAGIRPGIPVNEQSTDDLLWIRYEFIQAEDDFAKRSFSGTRRWRDLLLPKIKLASIRSCLRWEANLRGVAGDENLSGLK
jgi:serine/threonine protein phosphatase 1